MRQNVALIVVLVALAMTACTTEGDGAAVTVDGDEDASGVSGAGRQGAQAGGVSSGSAVAALAASLQQFDRCDALLDWIRTEAAERVGPYGFDHGPAFYGDDTVVPETTAVAATELAAAGSDGGGEFSTTNVQEAGVDEADIVKTDGERLYVLADQTLHVIEATPSSPRRLDSLRLGDVHPAELLLGGDRLYVIGSTWIEADDHDPPRGPIRELEQEVAVVAEVAVAPDGELTETARLEIAGWYVTSRQIGDGVRLVVRHDPELRFPFVYPSSPDAEDAAAEHNRNVVMETDLEDWLPWFVLTTGAAGTERSGVLTDCGRVAAPREFSGMSTVSVLSLTIGDPLGTGNALTLFGAADTVYASSSSLYAATYAFPEVMPFFDDTTPVDPDPEFTSQIHRFDITDPDGADYVASGEVKGRLLNQFALSEHEGHLRVATTEGSPWFCCQEAASSSSVVVLRTEGDALVETGVVDGLGVGESIFGVRFVGDRGYVVTFRQTDPLYVIDLADPEAPRVAGELKITGYSAYLHPVSDDLVLGVGQEATRTGMTTGTKVSLFDVSDASDPREVDRWVLDDSSSTVEWDHRALLYWAPEELAVVPIESWGSQRFGAVALSVAGGRLRELGLITQSSAAERDINPACEQIEPDEDVAGGELSWIVGEGALVRCPDGETPTLGGFYCEPLEAYGVSPSQVEGTAGGDTVDVCWPDHEDGLQISRVVVIGDALWTIGRRVVQANDLATLEPLGSVDL